MKQTQARFGLITLAVFALLNTGHSALLSHPSVAAPIVLHLLAEKQIGSAAGQPQWAALTEAAQPGNALRYTVQVRNRSASTVHDLVVTQPVPAGMTYRAGSALGSPTFSLDGKAFSALPSVPVRQADGTTQQKPAAPETYKALRWHLAAIPADATQSVAYQVEVR